MKHGIMFSLMLLLQFGCKKNEPGPTAPQNHPPVIHSITSTPTSSAVNRIPCSSQVTLSVVATDADKDSLRYLWNAVKGTFVSGKNTSTAIWQPPQIPSAEDDTIFVSVSDIIATTTSSITLYLNPPVPTTPSLYSPHDQAINQWISPTLNWNRSFNLTSYGLQVSTSSSFVDFIRNDTGLKVLSSHLTGLSLATTYYWRMNAKNEYGTTPWSAVWSFTTVNSLGNPCPGLPSVAYAGRTYNTVQIGAQCWLKENLDVGTIISVWMDQTDNGKIEKYCYGNDTANCRLYGGFYQWDEAMQYGTTSGAQGICPQGWHIPTLAEFTTLDTTVGGDGNALKAIGQGTGTNASGFSALLGGGCKGSGDYYDIGVYSFIWTSDMINSTAANGQYLDSAGGTIWYLTPGKPVGLKVRCIKDVSPLNERPEGSFQRSIGQNRVLPIGGAVPNIVMPGPSGDITSLMKIDAEKILILFYSNSCPHCLSLIPSLAEVYNNRNAFQVIAISLDSNRDDWTSFIRTNKLDWINLNDGRGWSGKAASEYHIYATPTMILVGKDKKIIAKPMTIEELVALL